MGSQMAMPKVYYREITGILSKEMEFQTVSIGDIWPFLLINIFCTTLT